MLACRSSDAYQSRRSFVQGLSKRRGRTRADLERAIILDGEILDGEKVTRDETVLSRLEESERRFRASMEHSPIGMALTGMDGVWIDVNPALCDFLGYPKEELMKVGFKHVTHPEDRDATVKVARQMIASHQKSVALEKRYIHASGKLLTGILNLTIVRDENEIPAMYISQIQDITAARRLEYLKSEFITTVNHELRTPLTGIIGALSLLDHMSAGSATATDRNLISVASRNAARLKSLLDDILEMETLASDIYEPLLEDVAMSDLVEQVVEATRFRASAVSVDIRCVSDDVGLLCNSDRAKLSRVFGILIANAVKFSEHPGTVIVHVEQRQNLVRVSVSNKGRPIPEGMRDFIFQTFVQADSTNTRRNEGAGLGLAIAKHLVEHLKGDIGYSSDQNGTTFWMDVPKKRPE